MINSKYYEKMTVAEGKKVTALRTTLAKVPARKLDQNLLLATFNIREFGARGRKRKGYAINALAEICSRFDIVAIQELRPNLNDLKRMLKVMGPWWKVVFNDPASPEKIGGHFAKGNGERFAYLYDSRVVRFTGMAAELLIVDDFLGTKGVPKTDKSVPWRTPYMASFRAGNFDFMLLTVHIQWNKKGGIAARSKEIEMITGWIGDRQKDASLYDPDIFVLGDFNIPGLKSKTYKALVKHGLTIPTQLRTIRTNLKQNAHYDQIGYYEQNTDCTIKRAGSIDIVPSFFKGLGKSAHDAMTYQLSDHLPLWVELEVHEANLDQFIKQ